MRSNSKEVKEAIRKHIIEICETVEDQEITTLEEAKKYIAQEFNNFLCDYELRKHKTIQNAFIYWLSGLPLATHYTTHDIIEYLHSIGLHGKDQEQEENNSSYLYHYLIFRECKDVIFDEVS
jgi:hypothetical protein